MLSSSAEILRHCLARELSLAAGIDTDYLEHKRSVMEASVAARMFWASKQLTQRIEDSAYSLLGLFDANMPLLYSEGHKAFLRLQSAIIQSSDDPSNFA